jgi:hypothetical protein
METMCKIHKQDEFNGNQRITSDALLYTRVWKDLTITD